jgi:hypothetical protein
MFKEKSFFKECHIEQIFKNNQNQKMQVFKILSNYWKEEEKSMKKKSRTLNIGRPLIILPWILILH